MLNLGSGKSTRLGAPAADSGGWKETAKVVIQALALAMLVRVFLFQPFNIPSGSMKPTLLVGDYLFVSKLSYGYSGLSLFGGTLGIGRKAPGDTSVGSRWFGRDPKRGDVVVFKLPRDVSKDYIKRLIGLPGDEIQMRQGVLHINGVAVPKTAAGQFVDSDEEGRGRRIRSFEETLPNGVKYTVLDAAETSGDNTGVYKVPAGHFFMMGDNRDNSQDSRFPEVGYVPLENLVGRADLLFFSTDSSCGYAPDSFVLWQTVKTTVCSLTTGIRFRRLFNIVR